MLVLPVSTHAHVQSCEGGVRFSVDVCRVEARVHSSWSLSRGSKTHEVQRVAHVLLLLRADVEDGGRYASNWAAKFKLDS